ncbi:hypothetical protein AKJ65_04305 [candidate division MSBL1 archaeon SCGC-AAA259E19]|uniref:Uncharacterized protein n=1 Tax=candidate division MSBL1 archaeon SCGC-AAA259E19 TaxID=1698264 RepID=A0A133UK33_9EURY|nr:hypothetical protein AKJ65_04305 [candidate division MSBL1 archaeon SCGC-AAA259E19]
MNLIVGCINSFLDVGGNPISDIVKKKDEIVERVVEINERFVRMVVDEVIDCLENCKEVLNDRWFDEKTLSSLVVEKCSGMPFANEARVRRVIDAMLWDLFRDFGTKILGCHPGSC